MATETLEDLLQTEAIKRVKARYCRFIDSRRWDLLEGLLTPDLQLEGFTIVDGDGTAATFVDALAKRLDGATTVHHCHTPEIRLTGTGAAEGSWAMMDLIEWPHPIDLKSFPGATGFRGYGFYEERYRLVEGAWRIAVMRLTRTRFEPLVNGVRPQEFDLFEALHDFMPPSGDWMA